MPETERLKIIPLTYTRLLQYLKADNVLEEELGLAWSGRTVADEVKDMVESFTLPAIRQGREEDFVYYTVWIVIHNLSNTIVAELGFKGPPNERGEIEIGYGTLPCQQGKGYMTEALAGMLSWAAEQEGIIHVLAETDASNLASIQVLQKNGFEQFDTRGEMLWWRKGVR